MKSSGNVHAAREDNSGSSRVRLKRTRNAVRFLMLLLLVAAFGLLTLAVLYYTRNTMEAMEMELCQKMQVSVEQTRSNMDYRFLQTAEDASTLMGTLFEFGCGYGRTAAGIFQDMPGFGRKSGQKYDFQPAAVCAG